MSPKQLWHVLKSKYKLLIFIVIMAVILTYTFSKAFIDPFYKATTTLLIDFDEAGIDSEDLPAMLQEEYMITQLGILKSSLVAKSALDILGYAELPEYKEAFEENYRGTGSIQGWLEDTLLDDIRVRIIPKSRLIKISFTSDDAEGAAEITNAYSQAFREVVLKQNLDPVKVNSRMLEEQLVYLRLKLTEAKKGLNALQKKKNVLITEDRLDIEALQLKTLTEKLATAKAEVQVLQNGMDQVNVLKSNDSSLRALPDVMENQQVRSLQASLYAKKTRLAELSLNIGVNHPQYKSVAKEISSLTNNIRAERKKAVTRMENQLKGAKKLVLKLEKAKDVQKNKVIELKQGTGDLPVLQREVESAQRSYEKALLRAEDYNLLTQVKYTNVTVIDPAKIPDLPDGPDVKRNLLLAFILGLILGSIFILILELREKKIRSKEGVIEVLGDIPLLGSLNDK